MTIITHPKYPKLIGVRSVKPLDGFRVHVVFTDDTEREIDLEPHLWGPVFEPIRNDPKMFASVFVDPIGQTLAWPNEVDIAPETLYYEGDPPWAKKRKPTVPKPRPSTRKSIRRRAPSRRTRERVQVH